MSNLNENEKESSLRDYYYYGFNVYRDHLSITEPIDFIYHYTTIDAFKSIIGTQKLYATRFDYLNDESERKDIINVLQRVIESYKNDKPLYDLLKSKELKNVDSYFSFSRDKDSGLIINRFKKPEVFFISFCQDHDNWLMWNTYVKGDKKEGIALGFCIDNHKTMDLQSSSIDGKPYSFEVFPVIYDNKEKEQIVKHYLDIIRKRYTGSEDDKIIVDKMLDEIISAYQDRFKDEHFSGEKEVRVAIIQDKDEQAYPVKYRKNASFLIPYIEFDYIENLLRTSRSQLERIIKNERVINIMIDSQKEEKVEPYITLSPYSNTKVEVVKDFLEEDKFLLRGENIAESEMHIRKQSQ